MLVFLPPNLKSLADLVARREHARFGATYCVRLTEEATGLYRAEATDGYVLGIARGPSPDSPDVIDPTLVGDAAELLIPQEDWREAFKLVPKAGRSGAPSLAVASAEEGGILFATSKGTSRAAVGEGRFPDTNRVLPTALPLVSVLVDPDMLTRVLKVASGFREEDSRAVALHFWRKGLLGVTARNPQTGQAFDALCVPLTLPKS